MGYNSSALKKKRKRRLRLAYLVLYAFVLLLGALAIDFVHTAWLHQLQSIFLVTGGFFGVLFYSFWGSLRRTWFLKGLTIILPVHAVIVWALISINPLVRIAKVVALAYGGLISLVYVEWIVAAQLVEVFERRDELHAHTTQRERMC
jgi:hypothetical protein